jgi:L-iditol 2-dehydrogenase
LSQLTTPAIRQTGRGVLERAHLPVGEPGEGEVLLEVLAVGLCGSDSHWYREGGIGDAVLADGLVLGHEFAALVRSGPDRGRRVAVDPAIPCIACEQCLAGRPNLCLDLRFAGHNVDGALRRHMAWPERCLVPLPEALDDEQGALLEPLGVSLHAIDLAGPVDGRSVGVVGCGPIGLLLIAALRDLGAARIVATEPLAHRLAVAPALGATECVGSPDAGNDPFVSASAGGYDVVFDTAGSDAALHRALSAARPGGRVVLVGIPDADRSSFMASLARRKELTMTVCRRMLPGDLARAALVAERGVPGMDLIVTHRYGLDRVEEAFETLVARTGIKVLVVPWASLPRSG